MNTSTNIISYAYLRTASVDIWKFIAQNSPYKAQNPFLTQPPLTQLLKLNFVNPTVISFVSGSATNIEPSE
jgi:hypothetical protein